MKKTLFFLTLAAMAVLGFTLLPFYAWCQAVSDTLVTPPPFPTDPAGLTLDFLLQWTDAIYGALVIGISYLSAKIPGINKIPRTAWRVAAIALVLAMGFIVAGKGIPMALLFTFFASTKLYDLLLSLIVKTPKPKPVGNATPTPG